jgi:hypothetical protein
MPRPARRPLERRLRRVVDVGGVPLGVLPPGEPECLRGGYGEYAGCGTRRAGGADSCCAASYLGGDRWASPVDRCRGNQWWVLALVWSAGMVTADYRHLDLREVPALGGAGTG